MKKMILIDVDQCGGCKICETACAWAHSDGVFNPRGTSAISVIKNDKEGTNVPFMCLQCEVPYCQKVCPVNAIYADEETGAKLVDHDTCIGCKMCVIACPFGGAMFESESAKIVKCDFCKDVGEPQCVKWCPKDVLEFVDVNQAGLIKKERATRKLAEISSGGKLT